jgi:hypothetical protein
MLDDDTPFVARNVPAHRCPLLFTNRTRLAACQLVGNTALA